MAGEQDSRTAARELVPIPGCHWEEHHCSLVLRILSVWRPQAGSWTKVQRSCVRNTKMLQKLLCSGLCSSFKLIFYKVCKEGKKFKWVSLGQGFCVLNSLKLFQETPPDIEHWACCITECRASKIMLRTLQKTT